MRRRGQSLEALRRTHLHPAPPDQLFSDGLEHLLCGRTPFSPPNVGWGEEVLLAQMDSVVCLGGPKGEK